jgi:hypothetical protein
MKKEEILCWLAFHWHELESESDQSYCIPALDDEADIRQVNAEVLSCLGYRTSRPLPEDPFRHYLRREKVAVAGHQDHGKGLPAPVAQLAPNLASRKTPLSGE